MTHWILIADASGARVFSVTAHNAPLELVREFHNPEGRERNQELVTDGPGRLSKSATPGTRSAMDPRTTPHEEAANHFARELVAMLRHELSRTSYDSLSLVAPPHFLGVLRKLLDKDVEEQVRGSLARDLVHMKPNELRPHVESLLSPGVFV